MPGPVRPMPGPVGALPTPALLVDGPALEHNLANMASALPGARLRPHVKAHKCTALARLQRAAGHPGFTCATLREMEVLAAAGLGEDLLLANEVLDRARLENLVRQSARVTIAVDSPETIAVAAAAGVAEVLIDVNVGLPRCGCPPAEAGALADRARRSGLAVRGVMGYEGHAVGLADRGERRRQVDAAIELLAAAHAAVGGDVVSAGGTGTFDMHPTGTEVQAGSYALMDTAYATLDVPFVAALSVLATVVSVHPSGWAVADAGLKAFGMDHGNPTLAAGGDVWFCSDEHVTFSPPAGASLPRVGDRVELQPAHVDPTVAYHDRMYVVDGDHDRVLDVWPVDMRGWLPP